MHPQLIYNRFISKQSTRCSHQFSSRNWFPKFTKFLVGNSSQSSRWKTVPKVLGGKQFPKFSVGNNSQNSRWETVHKVYPLRSVQSIANLDHLAYTNSQARCGPNRGEVRGIPDLHSAVCFKP